MELRVEERELTLVHPWTIARGSTSVKRYAYVEVMRDGIAGLGEAAHNIRYGESIESVRAVFAAAAPLLRDGNPWRYQSLFTRLGAVAGPCKSALAALDMALWDWLGRSTG
ncbi:MAG: dipeptide epimerase, partial [Verrucomicrobiales bacterium]